MSDQLRTRIPCKGILVLVLTEMKEMRLTYIFRRNERTKGYEYRKNVCRRKIDKILIYSTNPVMKVVGEAEVEDVLIDDPEMIWKKTEKRSGIEKAFFDRYFENRKQAVAYKLKNVIRYGQPKELKDYGLRNAPQSFQYIEESWLSG